MAQLMNPDTLFAGLDYDENQFITMDELLFGFPRVTFEELYFFILNHDSDNDAEISQAEFFDSFVAVAIE